MLIHYAFHLKLGLIVKILVYENGNRDVVNEMLGKHAIIGVSLVISDALAIWKRLVFVA